jgi:hypothetical protein
MFGLNFVGLGVLIFSLAGDVRQQDGVLEALLLVLFSSALTLLGIRIFRNGFPRPTKPGPRKIRHEIR